LERGLKRERVQKEKGKRIVIRKSVISSVHEAGQSLVEFALVTLFVILPVTFGIIDGSILFYKWVALTNGAREGARAGAIYHYGGDAPSGDKDTMWLIDEEREDAILLAVNATVGPLIAIEEGDLVVTYDPLEPCVTGPSGFEFCRVYRSGDLVTGAITHTHTSMVGLVIGLGEIDLSVTATMRIEPGGPAPSPPP